MRAEIITVGSELVFGRTVDTHSSYVSRECYVLGIEVFYHTSVGDSSEQLYECISLASSRSDLVFLCGGLGPTADDITKEVLATYLGVELVQDEDVLKKLQKKFLNVARLPSNNLKQTYVFPSGFVFSNDIGTAPGLFVKSDGVIYILLPGPPSELIPMFQTSVHDFLKQLSGHHTVIHTHTLSFFGIGESFLEDQLQDMIVSSPSSIVATYLRGVELTLCITVKAKDMDQANAQIRLLKEQILDRVGLYCFNEDGENLEEVITSLLRKNRSSLAVAESCTGGLLCHLLSTVPGSSDELKGGWICYTNQIKKDVVGIPEDVLDTYGAVSTQTAELLACNVLECFKSHYALSITGVAGPTSAENKPIGLVYISLAEKGKPVRTYQFEFSGSRKRIQLLAAKYALFILLQRIEER